MYLTLLNLLCLSIYISHIRPTHLSGYALVPMWPDNRGRTVIIYSNHSEVNTLLKSDVTSRDRVVRCHGSKECGSRFVNFACQFYWRWHSLRITLKSTTLLFMRSSNVWNRDNGASDVWALTAYTSVLSVVNVYFMFNTLKGNDGTIGGWLLDRIPNNRPVH